MKNLYQNLSLIYNQNTHIKILIFILFSYIIILPFFVTIDSLAFLRDALKGYDNPLTIYRDWDISPFEFVYGPIYSYFIILHSHFLDFLGFDSSTLDNGLGFNSLTFFTHKLFTVYPITLVSAFYLFKLCKSYKSIILFLTSPLIIWFSISSGREIVLSIMFICMGMYYYDQKKEKVFFVFIGLAISACQPAALLYLPLILLCLFNKNFFEALICISLLFLPHILLTAPYEYYATFINPHNPPSHYLKPGLWDRMNLILGAKWFHWQSNYFLSIILYTLLVFYMIFNKPKLNLSNISLFSFITILIFMMNYGLDFERYSILIVPFAIYLICNFKLKKDKNNNLILYIFYLLSSLPALAQLVRRSDSFYRVENYTTYEPYNLPINLFENIMKLSPASKYNYLFEAQMIASYLNSFLFGIIISIFFYLYSNRSDFVKLKSNKINHFSINYTKNTIVNYSLIFCSILFISLVLFNKTSYFSSNLELQNPNIFTPQNKCNTLAPTNDYNFKRVTLNFDNEQTISLPSKQFNTENFNKINIDSGNGVSLKIIDDEIEICFDNKEDIRKIKSIFIKIRQDIPIYKVLFRNYKDDITVIDQFKKLPNELINIR